MTSNSSSSQGSDLAVLIGTVLAGRYRLTRDLGSGATTAIFDAVDEETGQEVTLKLIRPRLAAVNEFRDRFDEAMRGAAALRHPNIAIVHDFGFTPVATTESAYVVTERLTGGSLRDLFDRGRRLTPSQALVVGLDVCRALDVAHRRNQVHGELVPSKIVFGDDRRLRIVDFGLSRLIGRLMWVDPSNVPNHVAGYASPEQATGQRITGKSDVYSLALTLTEAITGDLPFKAESTTPTLAARVGRLLPVTADMGPLASVLEHAARPDVDDRSTAAEFGKNLVQIATRLPRPEPLPLLSAAPLQEADTGQGRATEGRAIPGAGAQVGAGVVDGAVTSGRVDPRSIDRTLIGNDDADDGGDGGEARRFSDPGLTMGSGIGRRDDDRGQPDDDGTADGEIESVADSDERSSEVDDGFELSLDEERADDDLDDFDDFEGGGFDADEVDIDELLADDDGADSTRDDVGAGEFDGDDTDADDPDDDDAENYTFDEYEVDVVEVDDDEFDDELDEGEESGEYEAIDLTGIDMEVDAAPGDDAGLGATGVIAAVGDVDDGATGVIAAVGDVDDGATGVIAAVGDVDDGATGVIAAVGDVDDGATGVIAAVGDVDDGATGVIAAVGDVDDGATGVIAAVGSAGSFEIDDERDDGYDEDDDDLGGGYGDDLDDFDDESDDEFGDVGDGDFTLILDEAVEDDGSDATGVVAVTEVVAGPMFRDDNETGVVPVISIDAQETGAVPVTAGVQETGVVPVVGQAGSPPLSMDDQSAFDDDDPDGYYDDYPDERRRRSIPWKTIVGGLVLLGLVVVALVAFRLLSTPKYVVPDLTGKPVVQAQSEIASYGWDVRLSSARDATITTPDDVVRTNPAAGAEVAKGEPFEIVVSEGPIQKQLPDLVGLDATEAQQRLKDLEMIVTVERASDDTIEKGKVVRFYVPGDESIGVGSYVDPGTSIILVVSDGPARRTVPNLVGKPLVEARAAAEELGLTLTIASRQPDASVAVDTVLSQTVNAGQQVERGTEIGVVVSEEPTEAIFPDLSAYPDYESMKAAVEAAGFTTELQLGDGTGTDVSYTINGEVPQPGQAFELGTLVAFETL